MSTGNNNGGDVEIAELPLPEVKQSMTTGAASKSVMAGMKESDKAK